MIAVLLLVLGSLTLNNKSANKVPPNTNQSNSTVNKVPTNTSQNSTNTNQTPTAKTQTQIVDPNAAKFEGKDNLAKFEDIAQKNPSTPTDQVNAAVSSYVNQDFDKAVAYYKKALTLDPKNAQYLTYLGNVYFRGLNVPKEAVPYYQAATQNDPSYVYGWWNLAIAEKTLGDKDAAKATLQKGLASVSSSDPLYKQLQATLDTLK